MEKTPERPRGHLMITLLHLETATKVCSVAISQNGRLVSLHESSEDGYSHGENLTLFIQNAMTQANVQMNDLNGVVISSGPGSYTGLRIGAATAKGMCYALKIPLIAVDSLISLAMIAQQKHSNINLCAVIDARRMEVYNAFYSSQLTPLKSISADIIDENSYREYEPFVYFGDGANKLVEIWANRNCVIDSEIKSSAIGTIELSYQKYVNEEFEDVAYWEPFYLKDFLVGKKS